MEFLKFFRDWLFNEFKKYSFKFFRELSQYGGKLCWKSIKITFIPIKINSYEGLFYIDDCALITFEDISLINVKGTYYLINIIESCVNFKSGSFQYFRTYSSAAIAFLRSKSLLSNLNVSQFCPTLIYSLYSSLNVTKCSFNSSYEKIGNYELGALYFTYNNSFEISNSKFDSLSNNFRGSVFFLIFFSANYFKRQYISIKFPSCLELHKII